MSVVLAAIDASPRAELVLAEAIVQARARGGRVLLFRAVGLPPELPREMYGMDPERLPVLLEERAREDLTVRARTVPPELLAGTEVILGTPWHSIVEAAAKHKASCVVLGSHGYDVLDRVLGTTAARVVNHARCSVLVVR